jgi:AraC-like DNA-binding protein
LGIDSILTLNIMSHAVFSPPDQLKNLVRYFWFLESSPGEVFPNEYQSMADGCPELIFQYNGGFLEYTNFKAYLRAQHCEHKRLTMGKSIGLFGVRFYPHAIYQLFGIPADKLTNTVCEFNTITGYNIDVLVEKVLLSPTTYARIKLLSDFLTGILIDKNPDPIHTFITQIIQREGQVNIGQMHEQSSLSLRQFERRFKAASGFPPKYYSRIMRFISTKRKYISGSYKTLAELANACNYYDQSHFIHEFKEFSGMQVHTYFKMLDRNDNEETKVIKGLIIAKDIPS